MFQAEPASDEGRPCQRINCIQIAVQEGLIVRLHIGIKEQNPLGLSKVAQTIARMAAARIPGRSDQTGWPWKAQDLPR